MHQAFAEEGATQCGFCTPGFIVSLTGFCMSEKQPSYESAIDAMNGNICRCTGYKSIERAAAHINTQMQERKGSEALQYAVDQQMIPAYFLDVKERLKQIPPEVEITAQPTNAKFLGGGTDLYVQQHDTIVDEKANYLFDNRSLKGILQNGQSCI